MARKGPIKNNIPAGDTKYNKVSISKFINSIMYDGKRSTAEKILYSALEKMKAEIKAGKKPYKLQLVGLELGGKPIEEYAPDFWLISNENGGDPVGFITSPWYHPEKKQNIAMGYVPFDGTLNANGLPKGKVGTKYKVHLPAKYSDTPGTPVDAVIVDIPFKQSFNANTREVVKG